MEREILFRMWREKWGMSDVFSLGAYPSWSIKMEVSKIPKKTEYYEKHYTEWALDTDCKTMQYTGIKDSIGKRIFEGDIQRVLHYGHSNVPDEWVCVVEWNALSSAYVWRETEVGAGLSFYADQLAGMTTIGNIHNNPELLKANDSQN